MENNSPSSPPSIIMWRTDEYMTFLHAGYFVRVRLHKGQGEIPTNLTIFIAARISGPNQIIDDSVRCNGKKMEIPVALAEQIIAFADFGKAFDSEFVRAGLVTHFHAFADFLATQVEAYF